VNNRVLTIGGLALLCLAVLGLGTYIILKPGSDTLASAIATTPEGALALKPDDIGMGDPNAPIKMIEYASAGCPHCATMALETIPKLKAAYFDTGKVYYVLRDFPLDPVAVGASLIARCLPKEKFYPFMDLLFGNQKLWHAPGVNDPKEALIELARRAGLSREATEACLKDQKAYDRIGEIQKESLDVLKIEGTPTTFLNGERFEQALTFEAFDAKIKELEAALPK
jgi:protein-disulfide isomerase